VASTLIKTLRCEWIHGFIADFFNTIGRKPLFAKLKAFKGVAMRSEKTDQNFPAMIYAAPLSSLTLTLSRP
ncbi:hypothetical protein NKG95_33835, partial [Mesorhizobium sp. M1423]|uniref:hypothetical protein n=1 Tax=Mesorhizobium sp. M1423 TaxID=2957101 RepID=UPI0033390B52